MAVLHPVLHVLGNLQATGGPQREQHATVDLEPSLVYRVQCRTHVLGRHIRQKSHTPQVDSQNQRIVLHGEPCTAQEGAVPTQRDDEIGMVGGIELRTVVKWPAVVPHIDVRGPHGVLIAPCTDAPTCFHGLRAPAVNDEADSAHRQFRLRR